MIGETVAGYQILRKLGEGTMGVVYLAEHWQIGKQAAIKLLLPEHCADAEVVRRFLVDATAASQINHPSIVNVFDVGEHHDGSAYVVMEILEGESLATRLLRGPLPHEQAVGIARQTANALAAAHDKGIVHRDLKPENVFLVADDATAIGLRAKVLDFGIAKLTLQNGGRSTRTGMLLASPTYMSPEQCRGESLDARTDIYSLGCIAFEMVTGAPPFRSEKVGDILEAHLFKAAPAVATPIDPAFGAAIARALAKNPDERFATIKEFARALSSTVIIVAQAPTVHDVQTHAMETLNVDAHSATTAPTDVHGKTTAQFSDAGSSTAVMSAADVTKLVADANRAPRGSRTPLKLSWLTIAAGVTVLSAILIVILAIALRR